MVELRRRRSVSSAYLLDLLVSQLAASAVGDDRTPNVVDLGGGTGGIATSLAALGHQVTVIDPSPDALASLERRTADEGLAGRIRGVQGDASDLHELVGSGGADVMICHRVLEVLESPAEALEAMAAVLRPGGVLSLLVSQRHSLVLTQALSGHIALARRTFADPARFEHDQVIDLVKAAGFTVVASHGIGAIADHVPESVIDAEPGAYAELAALEAEVSSDRAFRALAPLVHVFASTSDEGRPRHSVP
ncbi:MAG TPA: methyltransferase domain-containing protein [Propionibacteriaceae bacterium]|nr:methyltransferase domain-containing protein [Propionibacteriaceae bacterium]